ncbi:hypothetical protein DND58_20870, partial [Pseudomonas syringae pv. pisi]
ARLRFLVSDAMCKPVLRRDRLDFGYDNRFQNPTICSRRLPSSSAALITACVSWPAAISAR